MIFSVLVPLALAGAIGASVRGARVTAGVRKFPALLAPLAKALLPRERRESAVSLALVAALRAFSTAKPGARLRTLALTFTFAFLSFLTALAAPRAPGPVVAPAAEVAFAATEALLLLLPGPSATLAGAEAALLAIELPVLQVDLALRSCSSCSVLQSLASAR